MVPVAWLPLPEALTACLELLETDQERFERAALLWHARLCRHAPGLGLAEARAVLDALRALAMPNWRRGAHELALLCAQAELKDVAEALQRWRDDRSRLRARPARPRRDPCAA